MEGYGAEFSNDKLAGSFFAWRLKQEGRIGAKRFPGLAPIQIFTREITFKGTQITVYGM